MPPEPAAVCSTSLDGSVGIPHWQGLPSWQVSPSGHGCPIYLGDRKPWAPAAPRGLGSLLPGQSRGLAARLHLGNWGRGLPVSWGQGKRPGLDFPKEGEAPGRMREHRFENKQMWGLIPALLLPSWATQAGYVTSPSSDALQRDMKLRVCARQCGAPMRAVQEAGQGWLPPSGWWLVSQTLP